MKEHFLTGFIGFEHTIGKTRKLSMPAEDSHVSSLQSPLCLHLKIDNILGA